MLNWEKELSKNVWYVQIECDWEEDLQSQGAEQSKLNAWTSHLYLSARTDVLSYFPPALAALRLFH